MQITAKNSSKFTKKITHVDDMIIHNLIKYSVQTLLHLWDIKITNSLQISRNLLFLYLTNEVEFGQDILQDCVSSYHLYVWFFFVNLDDFFTVVCTSFHERCGFHQIRFHWQKVGKVAFLKKKERLHLNCFATGSI